MIPQDLHDFDDVAENYDLYLDAMYSSEDNHAGFQEFYLDFAKEYGKDGVIDIACGTGAVLLYLAEHGIMADGTDLSEAMCRVADEKAKEIIMKYSKCKSVSEFQDLNINDRDKYLKKFRDKGLSIRQISRLTGTSISIIRKQ